MHINKNCHVFAILKQKLCFLYLSIDKFCFVYYNADMETVNNIYPEKTLKDYPKDKTVYEDFADGSFYLFLEKHTFFLDVPHYHDSLEILYVIKGRTTVHINGAPHDLSEGEMFICNSQMVHFYENYEEDKLALIAVLSAKYLRTFRDIYKNANFPAVLRNKTANAEIYKILDGWFNLKRRNVLVDCAYSNLLLDKIVELYDVIPVRQDDENNALAINFINYVNENYNKDITLESTAKHFGYSKEYFSKKFKQTVDINFLTFVNTIRVQKAIEMLENPNNKMTFLEVCLACGFNNTTSLYRHLKKIDYTLPSTKNNE